MPASDSLQQYAAALGATGVALGAFGAHALKDTLHNKGTNHTETWRTAVAYQLFHATALLGVSALAAAASVHNGSAAAETTTTTNKEGQLLQAGQFMAFGSLLFSGSLYGLSLSMGPKKILGPTTPIGGLLMISGWVMLGMATTTTSSSAKDKK